MLEMTSLQDLLEEEGMSCSHVMRTTIVMVKINRKGNMSSLAGSVILLEVSVVFFLD